MNGLAQAKSDRGGSMYLVLPVPFRVADGITYVELQAANGLDRWADNFERLTVAAPVIPEAMVASLAGTRWVDVATLEHGSRILCQPLPWAYTPPAFWKSLPATRALIARTIASSQHLQFAIGGLLGDWAAIAALEARKQGRAYAIHTDRVEHEVMRKTASSAGLLRRCKIAVEAPLMERYHRHIIGNCTLGLWHGDDCFRAYSPWCRENHLVHDIHTKVADSISPAQLEEKTAAILAGTPLTLCYAGRLDPMKAPLEWLQSIAHARTLGASFQATWYGDGALLEQAKTETARLGLGDVVRFPGFVASRSELLGAMRAAHAMVFTHVTPESPRNLIEALVCGTPILGYDNAYAANLLDGQGGGELVPLHDTQALGQRIAALDKDRPRLAALVEQAAVNGRRFNDAAVFAERSQLIQRFA